MFTFTLDTLFFFIIITSLTGLLGRKIVFRRLSAMSATVGFAISLASLPLLYNQVLASGGIVTITSELLFMRPIAACLEIDMLSIFMAAIFLLIGLLTAIYSTKYMERDTGHAEYYTLLLLMVAGMIGVAFAGDFFTFFLCINQDMTSCSCCHDFLHLIKIFFSKT